MTFFDKYSEIITTNRTNYEISIVIEGWGYIYESGNHSDKLHEEYQNKMVKMICDMFYLEEVNDCHITYWHETGKGFTFRGLKRHLKEFKYALENESHPANKLIEDLWNSYQEEAKQIDWIDELVYD